jgi:hypothetical protein
VTSLAGKEKLLCEASLAAIEHQNQIVDAMFERDRVAKRAWRADRTRGRRTTENLVESSTALSA